ncbi:MAG: lipoprotein BA_5634 family protein [Clostridium sp.]
MKKYTKLIVSSLVLVGIFVVVSQGLQYLLKGNKMPFNAILVTGDKVDVNEGKEVFKDNTKEIKDYVGKMIVEETKKINDDGTEFILEDKKLLLNKNNAKEMLKNQIFRTRIGETDDIVTEVTKEIPNIDSAKNILFGSDYDKTKTEMEVKGIKIPVEYGSYSWLGYYPLPVEIIIVDDETYNLFNQEEINLSLIKFNNSKFDLRNPKDKAIIENKLSGIFDNVDISYVQIKE